MKVDGGGGSAGAGEVRASCLSESEKGEGPRSDTDRAGTGQEAWSLKLGGWYS